jgi:hypothetical protein
MNVAGSNACVERERDEVGQGRRGSAARAVENLIKTAVQ